MNCVGLKLLKLRDLAEARRVRLTHRDEGNPGNSNDAHRDAHEAQVEGSLHKLLPGDCDPQEDRYGVGDVEPNCGNRDHS